MKTTLKCILAIVLSFSFASCQKREIPTKLTGYFYTTDLPSDDIHYKLFVDGVEKGYLPYYGTRIEKLGGIDSTMKITTLKLEFMSGRHQIQAKDASGKIVSSGEFYFEFYKNETKSGVTGGIGATGSAMFNSPDEVAILLAKDVK